VGQRRTSSPARGPSPARSSRPVPSR
jgi:hypothetical protein